MAGTDRSAADSLRPALRDLEQRPYRYTLFAALRVVETAHPAMPRLGHSRRPAEDPVRIAQRPTLRFAPGEVTAFRPGTPHRVECESFGLFGPNGPLPLHLTEYADERLRQERDPTFTEFVNAFQHRLATLFYRAWADARPTTQRDRPEQDRFADYVGSLIGTGTPALQGRDGAGDQARLCRAGRFAPAARSAEGLEDILTDYFGMPCRIEPFQPRWLEIPPGERLALGRDAGNGLGRSANLGRRSWQCQFSFRIAIGPLTRTSFEGFLPGGPALGDLVDLVRAYLGDELTWDVALSMRAEEAPPLRLARGARLGWTSWLGTVRGAEARGTVIRGSLEATRPRADTTDRWTSRRGSRGGDQSRGAVREAG
ncbi:type VI secretion system baseplate subunit TssG [Sediminicurvatus halobius]|uniref:Type VI secretion system baseplate subunit TssG n=1 Tax=Sediminicurvatus halobius TaxID=2182432 RepID=A0A2U2N203_9GAMM|nr:type VI secretion system baseplate subunit TssG [Spiribacter halobius]PWG63265.1 type VI secretion system baseplate subunit TssG [Spiribacter halobius]UEX76662.1 type VI secretion system baseplate subunit TssG [Spiribacter halobius]